MNNIVSIFFNYFKSIDEKSQFIADLASKNCDVSEIILDSIHDIYRSIKAENRFHGEHFESAYHLSITPLLEFFIARILYHYSAINKLDWIIHLRRQFEKTSPDIRIFTQNKTIAIIEIKSRATWMQACFSEDRAKKDDKKRESDAKIKNTIYDFKNQIEKYIHVYGINRDQFFVLIPSLCGVDRIKYNKKIEDYRSWFSHITNVSDANLILLSNNPRLNLDQERIPNNYLATSDFEFMLKSLENITFN